MKDKVKKKRIKWTEVLSQVYEYKTDNVLWSRYMVFRTQHPDMSLNRCAYYVLKSYYSTIALRQCKKDFYEYDGYGIAVLHLINRL